MDRRREAEEDQVLLFFLLCSSFDTTKSNTYCNFILYQQQTQQINGINPHFPIYSFVQSIKERLELHTAKRDEELSQQQTPIKLSKKEKKKQKEAKKLAKQKKMDADKVCKLISL